MYIKYYVVFGLTGQIDVQLHLHEYAIVVLVL